MEEKGKKKKSLVLAFKDSWRSTERKTAEGHKEQSKKSTANKVNTIQQCVINRRHQGEVDCIRYPGGAKFPRKMRT